MTAPNELYTEIERLRARLAQYEAPGEFDPIAYVVQTNRDGSIGTVIAPTNYAMFDVLRAKLDSDPWVIAGKATVAPLYSALAIRSLQERVRELEQELRNIVVAKRFDRERFDDDTGFADWAQSRARHAIHDTAQKEE